MWLDILTAGDFWHLEYNMTFIVDATFRQDDDYVWRCWRSLWARCFLK